MEIFREAGQGDRPVQGCGLPGHRAPLRRAGGHSPRNTRHRSRLDRRSPDPSRVIKGKRMPGHMGDRRRTELRTPSGSGGSTPRGICSSCKEGDPRRTQRHRDGREAGRKSRHDSRPPYSGRARSRRRLRAAAGASGRHGERAGAATRRSRPTWTISGRVTAKFRGYVTGGNRSPGGRRAPAGPGQGSTRPTGGAAESSSGRSPGLPEDIPKKVRQLARHSAP